MKIAVATLVLFIWTLHGSEAANYKISTAEGPEILSIGKLVQELYRQLGHHSEIVIRPAKRSLMEANSGQSDAELARISGLEGEYPNLIRVREPVYTISFSGITKEALRNRVKSWQDMANYRLGYPRGYKLLDIRTRELNAVAAKNSAVVLKMIRAGRIEVGLLLTSDAIRLTSGTPGLVVLEPPVELVTLYHYVHVKHRRLVPSLEKILIRMNDSGEAKKILSGKN